MRNLHRFTAAGLLLVSSVVTAGVATTRSALAHFDRNGDGASSLGFAAASNGFSGGAVGLDAPAAAFAVGHLVALWTGDVGFAHRAIGGASARFGGAGIPENVLQEGGPEGAGGDGVAHGVIVFATEALAFARGAGSDRVAAGEVPPMAVFGCPDGWLDRREVSGELPRGGAGLQDAGYVLRFEVPEPAAYGLVGAAACAALGLVGRRRRGRNAGAPDR